MKSSGVTFQHDWSSRKEEMMERDILVMLRQFGARDPKWVQQGADGEPEEAPPKLYLHLECGSCKENWYAENFMSCRKCGQRITVSKVESGRVPMPAPEPEPEPETKAEH